MDAARQQNIIATRDQQSSELRFREAGVQTIAAVKQAYWTLKATLANVGVQQRSLELAQVLVRENKARVDIGQTPPLDLLQAEAEVAQRRENLIRATTAAEDAEDRLRRFIMDPADTSFWRVRLNPVDEAMGGSAPARCRFGRRDCVERALRPRARAHRPGQRGHERGVLQQSDSCPTCGSRRRTAAAASAAPSCCVAADSPVLSSVPATGASVMCSDKRSAAAIRPGASV